MLRITKYDPKKRDACGSYLIADEWSSYSEIGTTLNKKELSYEEYKRVEDAYISSIILFMECNAIKTLNITNLEKRSILDSEDMYLSKDMKDVFEFAENDIEMDKNQIDIIARLALREKLWCKLEANNMFVHFGWDYYMYIGSTQRCEKYIKKIHDMGIFIEKYESPYL